MKKGARKALIAIAAIIAAIIILSVLSVVLENMFAPKEPKLIGGQRDEHNCLIPAGYSWNAGEQRCVREWETNASLRYQD